MTLYEKYSDILRQIYMDNSVIIVLINYIFNYITFVLNIC